MTERPARPPTAFAPSAGSGSGRDLTWLVKERLGKDPGWRHFARNGAWICPFCLASVRGHDDTRSALVRAIEGHLGRRCSAYRAGAGSPQSDQVIADKQIYEDIAHLAATDPAWQVFDHEGYWYSPSSLVRVAGVRIAAGRFDSFTIQAMVNHMALCPEFRGGTLHPVETVQQARDRWQRTLTVANHLRQLLQFPLWRYTNRDGHWICPFCLGHIAEVVVKVPDDWQGAPELMAAHLVEVCRSYRPERPESQSESAVRKAASGSSLTLRDGEQRSSSRSVRSSPATTAPERPAARQPSSAWTETAPPRSTTRVTSPTEIPVARPVRSDSRTGVPSAIPVSQAAPNAALTGELPSTAAYRPDVQLPAGIGATLTPNAGRNAGEATSLVARAVIDAEAVGAAGPPASDAFAGADADDHSPPASTASDLFRGTALDIRDGVEAQDDEPKGSPPLDWMDDIEESSGEHVSARQVETDSERIKAKAVQQGFLQGAPLVPGFRFATCFEACSDVSGDFYEFIRLADGRVGFAQGDVSGHGIHAALVMSMAKKTLSIYAGAGHGPAETLTRVNDSLVDDLGGRIFVSVSYAILDPDQRTITWARAGHNPVIRFNWRSGAASEIKPRGMVVGMKKGAIFRSSVAEEITPVEAGDVFVVYTDGITEAMNRQQAEYGVDTLHEVVRRHAEAGPEALVVRIMESVRQFRGGLGPTDDCTLLVLAVD